MSVEKSFKINAKKEKKLVVLLITMAAKYCEILDFRKLGSVPSLPPIFSLEKCQT